MAEFRVVAEFPDYSVSDTGEVVRTSANGHGTGVGRVLKPVLHTYLYVNLYKNGKKYFKTVHGLVARAFLPMPDRQCLLEVNHKDGVKTNDRVSNLEWVTRSENKKHAHGVLGCPVPFAGKGYDHPNSKLSAEQVSMIRSAYAEGYCSQAALASKFGVSQTCVSLVIRHKTY